MKTKLLLFVLAGAAALFSACASSDTAESSTVQQTEIYQDYGVDYNNGQMMVDVTFRFGGPTGTTLRLTAPSSVSYNGQSLSPNRSFMRGTVYQFQGGYDPHAAFVFTDTAGNAYTNAIDFLPVEFGRIPNAAGKADRLLFPVSRVVKEAGTFVELTLTDAAGAEHNVEVKEGRGVIGFRNSVYFDDEHAAIAVEPDVLRDLPAGTMKVSLRVKKTQKAAQATHLGGSIWVDYHAKPVDLTLS